MSIILHIGRRHPGVRALYAVIYVVLLLGAVTMVYPFLLMVAGSTKSGVDLKDFAAIPRYLRDDVVLYRKHVEGFFNESLDAMNTAYDSDWPSFDAVVPSADGKAPLVAESLAPVSAAADADFALSSADEAASSERLRGLGYVG